GGVSGPGRVVVQAAAKRSSRRRAVGRGRMGGGGLSSGVEQEAGGDGVAEQLALVGEADAAVADGLDEALAFEPGEFVHLLVEQVGAVAAVEAVEVDAVRRAEAEEDVFVGEL